MVAAGGTYVDPALAHDMAADASRASPPRDAVPSAVAREPDAPRGHPAAAALTALEAATLRLAAGGLTNTEIAAALTLDAPAVAAHKASGMAKLGLGSRVALVRFAIVEGWMRDA